MQLQHANLPESAQIIADVIGIDKTMNLVRENKREVYVPKRFKPDHWLVRAIGEEAARQLSEEFGAMRLSLPCSGMEKVERNARIIQLHSEGLTYQQIADALGMRVSSVKMAYYRWLKGQSTPRSMYN